MQWPSDLDVAGDATLEPPLTGGCGAGFYAAPEVLLKKAYGLPVDVWALGVIWRELVTGSCQKWITPPMSLPLPSESGCLPQRLKMCTLLAGPMNDETLPGCERLPNWKACAAAQCQLGNTKRLPWPQHLTKLQTAMRPLIETALHLQPELRATAGQLKMKITELPCEFVPRPVMVASPKLGSSGWAGSAANDAVSGDQTMTLVTSGEEALTRSAVTVSGDPSTRCQSGLRKNDPIDSVSGDPSLGFRFRVQSLRRNSAVAYNILWATRAVGERGAGGWRGGGRAAEFVKPNKVRRSNPSQV